MLESKRKNLLIPIEQRLLANIKNYDVALIHAKMIRVFIHPAIHIQDKTGDNGMD